MWTEAHVICIFLAVISDFIQLSVGVDELREPLISSYPRLRKKFTASTGYFRKSMFVQNFLPWRRPKPLPLLKLYVNHVVCVEEDSYPIYPLITESMTTALSDRSHTKLLGIMFGHQLCPFVIPNPNVKEGGYLPAEVKIVGEVARLTEPGTTIDNIMAGFSGVKSIFPYLRVVELLSEPKTPSPQSSPVHSRHL